MRMPSHDEPETMSFRAATLDEAIALAERSLGARVRVVAANRIRRGGIGGFFAADLGVEVSVTLDEETIEQALERLVAESAVEERAQWLAQVGAGSHAAGVAAPAIADDDLVGRIEAALATPTAAPRRSAGLAAPSGFDRGAAGTTGARRDPELTARAASVPAGDPFDPRADDPRQRRHLETGLDGYVHAGPDAGPDAGLDDLPEPDERTAAEPPAMVRVEQILEELQALTAQSPFSAERRQRRVAVAAPQPDPVPAVVVPTLPTLPPRPVDLARAAAAAADAAASAAAPSAAEPVARPVAAPAPVLPAAAPVSIVSPDAATVPAAASGTAEPSQHQVELAIAAADQLIDALKREDGARRLSVRVVLRSGDQREVAAEVEWEAP